jgi:hypothetical protein
MSGIPTVLLFHIVGFRNKKQKGGKKIHSHTLP